MKIKNSLIEPFTLFLYDMELKGTQNRMRNRMVRMLKNQLDLIEEERKELIEQYAEKDSEGNLLTNKSDDGKEYYTVNEIESFNKEYSELLNEEFLIAEEGNNKKMLETVKEITLNCDKSFKGEKALQYESFCELFENNEILTN